MKVCINITNIVQKMWSINYILKVLSLMTGINQANKNQASNTINKCILRISTVGSRCKVIPRSLDQLCQPQNFKLQTLRPRHTELSSTWATVQRKLSPTILAEMAHLTIWTTILSPIPSISVLCSPNPYLVLTQLHSMTSSLEEGIIAINCNNQKGKTIRQVTVLTYWILTSDQY